MKKSVFRLFTALLAVIMTLQVPVGTNAGFAISSMTPEQWQSYYASLCEYNTLPTLCVGADETSLGLTWHAPAATAQPKVRVSANADMSLPAEFTGETMPAENDDQVVCRVTITGIQQNSVYYYQWFTGSQWSNAYCYESKGVDSYKMLVIGDIQIGGQQDNSEEQSRVGYEWQKVLDCALGANPDVSFLLSPGDNTSTGKNADEWQTLLMPESLRSLPLALAIGNHDKKGFAYNYYTYMPNEFYGEHFTGLDRDFWFRYGDALYLVFDATSGSAGDHMAMAKQATSLNPDAKWRIAVMHQALFGPGYSTLDPETNILLNAIFTPIFDSYDIDLVLTGHSHLQGRSHFMFESSVVGEALSGKTYVDPKGTIYLNSNAVCDHDSFSLPMSHIAYDFEANDVTAYTTIEFEGNSMAVKTFRGDNAELLDSITLEKTSFEHNDNSLIKTLWRAIYKVVEFLGIVYMKIDAVVVKIRGGHF